MERIDKIIASQGKYSRSDVKSLISKKRVTVDGEVIKSSSVKVDPAKNVIAIDGRELTVKKFVGSWRGKGAAWLCVCDCGNETIVTGVNLRRGYTRSCGCINKLTNEERRRVISELQGTDTKADREG